MNTLPMPPDWTAEHASDEAFKRQIIAALGVPSYLLRSNGPYIFGLFCITDPRMPPGSASLVADDGTTIRIVNIGVDDI